MNSSGRKGRRARVLQSRPRKPSAEGRGLSGLKVAAPGAQSSLPAQLEERWRMGLAGQWPLQGDRVVIGWQDLMNQSGAKRI